MRCAPDDVDCRKLAKLCLRHNSGDYYEVAETLATQLGLKPKDRRRVRRIIAHYIKVKEKER